MRAELSIASHEGATADEDNAADAGIESCVYDVASALEVGFEDGVRLILDMGGEVYDRMDVVEGREDGVVVSDIGTMAG